MIDWPEVIKALKRRGYTVPVIVQELKERGCDVRTTALYNLKNGESREPKAHLGFCLAHLLKEVNAVAYEELIVCKLGFRL